MEAQNFSHIVPTFRYKNAKSAINWLCEAFGVEEKVVFENDDGTIANAQLTAGKSMIMVASIRENEFDEFITHPNDINSNTMSLYIIVEDIESHYSKSLEHSAGICLPLTIQDYGGGGYTCKDPEGYLWNFGTYNPWKQ